MIYVNARAYWPLYLLLAAVLALGGAGAQAAEQAWTPRLEGRVTDLANVLSAEDRDRLSRALATFEKETLHQLGVLIVPGLLGERIETFALRVAKHAGLGHKGIDNGILVVLSMKERSVRIELGLGMEKHITSGTAEGIIRGAMVPAFRRGDFAGGLTAGLDLLMREARQFVVRPEDIRREKPK